MKITQKDLKQIINEEIAQEGFLGKVGGALGISSKKVDSLSARLKQLADKGKQLAGNLDTGKCEGRKDECNEQAHSIRADILKTIEALEAAVSAGSTTVQKREVRSLRVYAYNVERNLKSFQGQLRYLEESKMKITQKQLKQIIKEETNAVILEMRGPLRKLFRMENPNLNKYIDAFIKAMRDVRRRYEFMETAAVDGTRGVGRTAKEYEKLVKDLDDAQDALQYYHKNTGYDANKGQRAQLAELERQAKNLRDSIEETAEEVDSANRRARDRQRDADFEANRRAEKERAAARERSRYAYRPQASSSKRGSAYDKFGKRYQDRGSAIDITRLEETIASTISELLDSKEN